MFGALAEPFSVSSEVTTERSSSDATHPPSAPTIERPTPMRTRRKSARASCGTSQHLGFVRPGSCRRLARRARRSARRARRAARGGGLRLRPTEAHLPGLQRHPQHHRFAAQSPRPSHPKWLGFIHDRVWSGWVFAYDPEFAKYSVGHRLLGSMLEESHRRGHREFDFSTGAEAYKMPYATHGRLIGPVGRAPLRQRIVARAKDEAKARTPDLFERARAIKRALAQTMNHARTRS